MTEGEFMRRSLLFISASLLIAGCRVSETANDTTAGNTVTYDGNGQVIAPAKVTLARLDCGRGEFPDMNGFFSDRPGVYPPGPGKAVDSCYLIQHGDQQMIWDMGFPAALKGGSKDMGGFTAFLDKTIAEQLAQVQLKPADIDVVGISHMHGDHTGQAAEFPQARLLIGKADYEQSAGKEDPFGPWRAHKSGPLTLVSGAETDVFGDGSVVALHMPGHTPDHLALLIKLKSGPVLLTGDVYHSTIAREKRSMPSFNTSREQTLASMDKFEALAKKLGAKVIIQHEPADIAKLPAFPAAAK
jgi:glyoxylase-like metal-dependent hydrolase (beta-lactamase superfamily II)